MIIIEGPDNAGKTTLCKHLSQEVGIPIKHSGGPAHSLKAMNQRIDAILLHYEPAVWDRIPVISDRIYAKALDRETFFDDQNFIHYIIEVLKRHPVIIYCRPNNINLMLAGHKKGEHDSDEHFQKVNENAKAIINSYDYFFESSMNMPHYQYMYDCTDKHQLQFITEVVRRKAAEMNAFNQIRKFP